MYEIDDFSDERLKGWCIHCGNWRGDSDFTLDHVPTKSLLDRPLPEHTPKVAICHNCNNRLSLDEEYLKVFLACVLAGTHDPDEIADGKIARAIRRNGPLADDLKRARIDYDTLGGKKVTVWKPNMSRIAPPLVKNARGHFYYEMGEAAVGEPAITLLAPLESMSEITRQDFEAASIGSGYPEVGSRLLTRVMSGADLDQAWIVVQEGVYRYAVHEFRSVRIVMREYLAFEAVWNV